MLIMVLGEAWRNLGIIHYDDKKYSIEEVFGWLPENPEGYTKNKLRDLARKNPEIQLRGIFHGANVSRYSDRYDVFRKSLTCTKCGLKGTYFRIDIHKKDIDRQLYHFNLYGVNEEGQEILITKDHIIPKAKGGKDFFTNYQTMCVCCNKAKGDKI